MGIATYGHGYTLSNPSVYGMGSPGSTAPAQPFTRQSGFASYYEVQRNAHTMSQICTMINEGGKRYWDEDQKVPYMVKDSLWLVNRKNEC